MVHRNVPELTVADMMTRIRQQLAKRRAGPGLGLGPTAANRNVPAAHREAPLDNFRGLKPHIDWHQLMTGLRLAEEHAPVGHVPELARLPRPLRMAVQWGLRIILLLTRSITNRQREFNFVALGTIRNTHGVLRHFEQVQKENLHRLEVMFGRQNELLAEWSGEVRRLEQELIQTKRDLLAQEHRVGLLLEETRRRLPEPFLNPEQVEALAAEDARGLDSLIASLQEQAQGSREGMKESRRDYLPLMHKAGAGSAVRPVLDLGCGAGAWLELLREEGLHVRGVEANRVQLDECRRRGLPAAEGEPLAYLRSLPDLSVGAVTGFQLLERLPLPALVSLLDETVRVLAPGGVAVFEAPNPQNLFVAGYSFHLDPTRHRPVPGPLAKFLVEARGLCQVSVVRGPSSMVSGSKEGAGWLRDYFGQPLTYAVVGWKV